MTSIEDNGNVITLATPPHDADWRRHCILGETGKLLAVLASALAALRAVMPDAFTYDEMLCAPMLKRPHEEEPDCAPRPVTDVDVGMGQERLQHVGLKRLSKDVIHQAI